MRAGLLAATLCVILPTASGCATRTAPTQETSLPTQLPSLPSRPPNGETAAQAAKRIFSEEYDDLIDGESENSEVIVGSVAGAPVPVARDYGMFFPLLVQWVLQNDRQAVEGNMFDAMERVASRDDHYIIPMEKDGDSVCEFDIALNQQWEWEMVIGLMCSSPEGQVHDFRQAERKLIETLGDKTEVRPVMFLPSGLAFAVGDNGGREAAVYLTFESHGEGVGGFHKYLPDTGTLYTPSELKDLLTP